MRPRGSFPEGTSAEALRWMKKRLKQSDYWRFQAVYFASGEHMTNAKIGQVVGYSTRHVAEIFQLFREHGFAGLLNKARGGRTSANLTVAEETAILSKFFEKARVGGVLLVHDVHDALNKATGHRWSKSSVYELLDRHNWRKIVPRRSHPKRDRDAQSAFKKNFSARHRTRRAR